MEGVLYKWTNYLSGERRAGRAGPRLCLRPGAVSRALPAGLRLVVQRPGLRRPAVVSRAFSLRTESSCCTDTVLCWRSVRASRRTTEHRLGVTGKAGCSEIPPGARGPDPALGSPASHSNSQRKLGLSGAYPGWKVSNESHNHLGF